MIVFGVGASTCAAVCEELAASRLTEVTITTVPAGTSSALTTRMPDFCVPMRPSFRSPLEAGAVGPDAVKNDRNLAGDCDLGLLGTDPFHQPDAPCFSKPTSAGF